MSTSAASPTPLTPLPAALLHHLDSEQASLRARATTVGTVLLAHLAGGWGLMQVDSVRQAVSEAAPIMVRLITDTPEPPPPAPPPPQPVKKAPPPPRALVAAAPKPQPAPEPVAFISPPAPPEPTPPQPVIEALPAPPAPPAPPVPAPKVISASDIRCPIGPDDRYPSASTSLGETGTASVRVLIDATGKPRDAVLQSSSGFARLDRAALANVRALRCKPFTEAGVAQAVWVVQPITFTLE